MRSPASTRRARKLAHIRTPMPGPTQVSAHHDHAGGTTLTKIFTDTVPSAPVAPTSGDAAEDCDDRLYLCWGRESGDAKNQRSARHWIQQQDHSSGLGATGTSPRNWPAQERMSTPSRDEVSQLWSLNGQERTLRICEGQANRPQMRPAF